MANGDENWKKTAITAFAGAAITAAGSVVGYRIAHAAIDLGGIAATTIWDFCCASRRAEPVKVDDKSSEHTKAS